MIRFQHEPLCAFFGASVNTMPLVLEVALSHVKEGLSGHGAVFYPLLLRHEREYRIHERRFSGRRRRLDDNPKGFIGSGIDEGRELIREHREAIFVRFKKLSSVFMPFLSALIKHTI
jgi:hypothetical protein